METMKPMKISRSQEDNQKIAQEIIDNGGAVEIKISDEDKKAQDAEKLKDFIKAQKDYRVAVKDNLNAIAGLHYQKMQIEFVGAELEELNQQVATYDTCKHIAQWNGNQYPLPLLNKFIDLKTAEVDSYKTGFNRDIEKLVDITTKKVKTEKELTVKFNLNDAELENIMGGTYVKEIKE